MKPFDKLQKFLLPWEFPHQLPLSFQHGDQVVHGIPAPWHPEVTVRKIDQNITETTVVAISPDGLELKVICKRYHDYAAAEFSGFFTNHANTTSPLLQNIRFAGEFPGSNATLYHGNGDTLKEDGYEWWHTPLNQPFSISPCGDGTSCNGAFPYMRLRYPQGGVNIAVGWTGTWIAEFTPTSQGVALCVGQKRCHMVLHPGETMRIPSLTLVAYEGNDDAGRNTWRHWYFDHVMPQPVSPKCCLHLFGAGGKPEFTGATEKNQLEALQSYCQKGLRPDIWWIDAGWYPCDFEWTKTGDWRCNPENFPRGLSPIGKACKEKNIDFLLWFEPERVWSGSPFAKEHPQWVLPTSDYNRLVNLGITECCDYIISLLDGFIKEFGVTIYRQDFNVSPRYPASAAWEAAEADDRIGAVENLHIQGYYRMWDSLLQRNPGLLIDSCASGGRRNDIETMRRSVTLHYTDVGYGHHPIKLKQHRQMFEWIPYFRAHNHNWVEEDGTYGKTEHLPDRFSYYVAMAPALTDVIRFDADESACALAREMQAIWRKAARYMLDTDYYPLTACTKSPAEFYAAQFHDPATGKGMVHLINGAAAQERDFTVQLKGLEQEAVYMLTSVEENRSWTQTGAALMEAMAVTLDKKSADIRYYEKK